MKQRKLTALTLATIAVVVTTFAYAQQPQSVPDFSGLWKRTFQVNQTFDVPPSGTGPIVQDPRYPGINSRGETRGPMTEEERERMIRFTQGWVADTSNPILQPQTKAALEVLAEQELQDIPHPQPQTMCMPSGVPHILNSGDAIMILQTPTEVIFLYSRDHHVRRVYLNEKHSKDLEHSWWGESVGHYEGDTLVIDTIGQTDIPDTDRFGTPHSDQIRVVERYRISDDGKTLEGHFTVEDPIAFTMPWSARADYVVDSYMYLENVCAESQRQYWPGREIKLPSDDTPDF